MSFPALLALALALAMDAFAVALAAGVHLRPLAFRPCFRLSFHFGLFQALMPVIGWTAGLSLRTLVQSLSHWIAFALLAAIGGHMLFEALNSREGAEAAKKAVDPSRGLPLLGLALATSIDALAVGLSLSLLGTAIWRPACIIGVVAALMTLLGLLLGHRAGRTWGGRAEVLGGVILMLVGTKILLSGLSAL